MYAVKHKIFVFLDVNQNGSIGFNIPTGWYGAHIHPIPYRHKSTPADVSQKPRHPYESLAGKNSGEAGEKHRIAGWDTNRRAHIL